MGNRQRRQNLLYLRRESHFSQHYVSHADPRLSGPTCRSPRAASGRRRQHRPRIQSKLATSRKSLQGSRWKTRAAHQRRRRTFHPAPRSHFGGEFHLPKHQIIRNHSLTFFSNVAISSPVSFLAVARSIFSHCGFSNPTFPSGPSLVARIFPSASNTAIHGVDVAALSFLKISFAPANR